MAEIIEMGGVTRLDIPADKVLKGAIGKLDQVVIVGIESDGKGYYAASSTTKLIKILGLLEMAKRMAYDAETP